MVDFFLEGYSVCGRNFPYHQELVVFKRFLKKFRKIWTDLWAKFKQKFWKGCSFLIRFEKLELNLQGNYYYKKKLCKRVLLISFKVLIHTARWFFTVAVDIWAALECFWSLHSAVYFSLPCKIFSLLYDLVFFFTRWQMDFNWFKGWDE